MWSKSVWVGNWDTDANKDDGCGCNDDEEVYSHKWDDNGGGNSSS